MTSSQKIAAILGAIGFEVSRIEHVRLVIASKGDDMKRFAAHAEEVLEKALNDLADIANGLGDFMNDTDMVDEHDEMMLTPVFAMMNPDEHKTENEAAA